MTTISIKYVNPPKEGKRYGTVKTDDNKLYGYDPAKVVPRVGQAEVTITSREYNGTTYHSIADYKPVSAAVAGKPEIGATPWWMPFVSNTVAHAIAAGAITSNEQIDDWAKAAKAAALALATDNKKTGDAPDDDIPF